MYPQLQWFSTFRLQATARTGKKALKESRKFTRPWPKACWIFGMGTNTFTDLLVPHNGTVQGTFAKRAGHRPAGFKDLSDALAPRGREEECRSEGGFGRVAPSLGPRRVGPYRSAQMDWSPEFGRVICKLLSRRAQISAIRNLHTMGQYCVLILWIFKLGVPCVHVTHATLWVSCLVTCLVGLGVTGANFCQPLTLHHTLSRDTFGHRAPAADPAPARGALCQAESPDSKKAHRGTTQQEESHLQQVGARGVPTQGRGQARKTLARQGRGQARKTPANTGARQANRNFDATLGQPAATCGCP